MEPKMTDDQKKRVIFESFPVKWQHAYIQSGRRIQTESLVRIVQYMKDEKSFNHNAGTKRKRNDDDNHSNYNRLGRGNRTAMRGGGRTGRGRGRNNNRTNPCRIHAGQHDWSECWDNENSPNYRPNRHMGRGGRGRHQQGRGGRGFGRNQSHYCGRGNFQQNYHNQNQGQAQQPHDSYHNDVHRIPSSNNTVVGTTTISSHSGPYYLARAAPSSGYAVDLHQYDLVQNEYGSAWSTGAPHNAMQNGRRY